MLARSFYLVVGGHGLNEIIHLTSLKSARAYSQTRSALIISLTAGQTCAGVCLMGSEENQSKVRALDGWVVSGWCWWDSLWRPRSPVKLVRPHFYLGVYLCMSGIGGLVVAPRSTHSDTQTSCDCGPVENCEMASDDVFAMA